MIGEGEFRTSISRAIGFFGEINLLQGANPNFRSSAVDVSSIRGLPYSEQWAAVRSNNWYDAQLSGGGLIQFNRTESKLSYYFFDPPVIVKSFDDFSVDFLRERLSAEDQDDISDCLALLEDDLREEYDKHIEHLRYTKIPTPVRYDYEPDLYTSGYHPASHYHYGFESQIRIGSLKIMTPLSFGLIVARQFFPKIWHEMIIKRGDHRKHENDLKGNLVDVSNDYLKDEDCCEVYIG